MMTLGQERTRHVVAGRPPGVDPSYTTTPAGGVALWPQVVDHVLQVAVARSVLVRARRGSGRSALLERIADRAAARGRRVERIAADQAPAVAGGGARPDRPELLLVDDLSDIDEATARALARAVGTAGVRLVGTLTDGVTMPAPLTALAGQPTTVVQLPPMEAPDADRLVRQFLGSRPALPIRRELLRLADGRAGVLVELLHDLADAPDRSPDVHPDQLQLGPRSQRRVERTLARLDLPAQRIVERLALGAVIPIAVLAPSDIEAADAAARAGVVDADGAARMRLSDPLVRRALLERMPAVTRHLHAKWLLDRLAAAPADTVPSWIAITWRVIAGETVCRDEMSRAALVAPDPHIAQALTEGAADGPGSFESAAVLARVSLVPGRTTAAESPLGGGSTRSTVEALGTAAAPPLLGAGSFALARRGRIQRADELIARSEPDDDRDLARLVQMIVLGDISAGLAFGAELPPVLRRRAAMLMAWGRLQQGRPGALPELLADGWSAAENPLEATASTALLGHGLLLGDLHDLSALLARWTPDTAPGRSARAWLSAELAAARGRHRDALAHLRAAEADASDVDLFGLLPVVRWVAVRVAAEAGIPWSDVGIERPPQDELPWGAPAATPAAVASVIELGVADRVEDATRRAAELVATAGESVMPAVLVLHAALRVGAPPEIIAAHLPSAARQVDSRLLLAIVDHIDAAVTGDVPSMLRAAQGMAANGHLLCAAEIRAGAGFASPEEDLPPTPALRRSLGLALTPRERELVRMVAAGLCNAEIAARLTLSVRTVETHLSAAYRKLGVLNRQQLREVWPSA